MLSEYTATVTGGVHSAYIDGHDVYLTDDATGSLRVIDFQDPKHPKEVARWQVENPTVVSINTEMGSMTSSPLPARSAGERRHRLSRRTGAMAW